MAIHIRIDNRNQRTTNNVIGADILRLLSICLFHLTVETVALLPLRQIRQRTQFNVTGNRTISQLQRQQRSTGRHDALHRPKSRLLPRSETRAGLWYTSKSHQRKTKQVY